jgi:hypothetical protein
MINLWMSQVMDISNCCCVFEYVFNKFYFFHISVHSSYKRASGFLFVGNMNNKWEAPFGLTWMTLNAGYIQIELVPVYINGVDKKWICKSALIDTGGVIRFSDNVFTSRIRLDKKPVTIGLVPDSNGKISIYSPADIAAVNDLGSFRFRFDLTGANSLDKVMNSVMKPNAVTDSITDMTSAYDGGLTIVYSTYADDDFKQGLTLNASVIINQLRSDSLSRARFDFRLYIPSFSSATFGASLEIRSYGRLFIAKNVYLSDVLLTFDYTKNTTAGVNALINGTLGVTDRTNTKLEFYVFGYVKQSTVFYLSGGLRGTWDTPFGLNWLSVRTAQISVLVDTTATKKVQQFTLAMGMDFLVSSTKKITLDANVIAADDFSQYTVEGVFAFGDNGCVNNMVAIVSPDKTTAPLLDDFDCSNTALAFGLFLSTSNSTRGAPGLYLSAIANIKSSGSGGLTKVTGYLYSFVKGSFTNLFYFHSS